MKTCLMLFLLACFVNYSESALSCFSCTDADTNLNCNLRLPEVCASGQVCRTSTSSLGGSYKISKGCADKTQCDIQSVFGSVNIGVASTSVKCCDYLLCNINGSTTARLNLLLLGVSALVLLVVGNITK
ncbi:lymphocyte antigen 6E-like isoform X1 [Erpetoichthys calabaricus]|uniref:lymphocyte antigen 6E-like isoform X1 n=1 Tax=Erpetoichthys calabaricus TaxID=27687 RepID=UPI00223443C4|nr:lymphocyte antigen 6E-like isoform X1 [Erpetoichthys calabaricus]